MDARNPGPDTGRRSAETPGGELGQDVDTVPQATIAYRPLPEAPPISGPDLPRRVGPYELLEEVARGGMGIIYKARHTVLDRIVALKTMRDNMPDLEELVQRFYQEARAVAHLNHRHIVPLYDVGDHEGRPYFAMAFVSGGSLGQNRAHFHDPRSAAALVAKVARAIHHAHEHGILHRDLKPSNILLDEHGEPLVSDFGLAKLLGQDQELTGFGDVLGSPSYMSPEQAAGRNDRIGPAADIWALGVLLYELLTGKRPFQGRDRGEITSRIRTEEPTRPSRLTPGLDRDVETIILKCLEKEPELRYTSAAALADDLERWLRGEPIRPCGRSWSFRAKRFLRRHRLAAALLLVLAAFAALLPFILGLFDPERPIQRIEKRLGRGQSAVIVGATGLPAWQRPVVGAGRLTLDEKLGLPFLETWETSLIELVRDPQSESYRLSAEVWHESSKVGEVGLYLLHSQRDTPDGTVYEFFALTFSEHGPGAGLVQASFRRLRQKDAAWHACKSRSWETRFKPRPPRWRLLEVVVKPTSVAVSWDGVKGEVDRATEAECATELKMADRAPAAGDPVFVRRGGLGVFAHGGRALFRSIKVDPLPR